MLGNKPLSHNHDGSTHHTPQAFNFMKSLLDDEEQAKLEPDFVSHCEHFSGNSIGGLVIRVISNVPAARHKTP